MAALTLAFGDAIHAAAKAGDLGKVKSLLHEQPALIDSKDDNGDTPLHIAAMWGQTHVAEFLLAAKAKVDVHDKVGKTPLLKAVELPSAELVQLLLDHGADANARDILGQTPMHVAARFSYKDMVQALLAHGANVRAKDHRGFTPLHCASCAVYKDAAIMLITKGADVDAKTRDGETPLVLAVSLGSADIAELLLASHASLKARDKEGETLLHIAARNGFAAEVALLLSHVVEISPKDRNGDTPLHLAAAFPYIDHEQFAGVFGALVAAKADINAKNRQGQTPLHISAAFGSKAAVELLLASGADVRSVDNKRLTPLELMQDASNPIRRRAQFEWRPDFDSVEKLLRRVGGHAWRLAARRPIVLICSDANGHETHLPQHLGPSFGGIAFDNLLPHLDWACSLSPRHRNPDDRQEWKIRHGRACGDPTGTDRQRDIADCIRGSRTHDRVVLEEHDDRARR